MRMIKFFIVIILSVQYVMAQTNEEVLSLMIESKVYFDRKKYSDAYIKINEAIELDKTNPELFFQRAEINFAIKKYEKAFEDYDKALKLKSDYSDAQNGKILSLNFMGRTKEALEMADKAIDDNPADPTYHYSRGIIQSERGKYAKAIDDFDKALSLGDKNEFRNFLYRGVAKLNLQEFDAAHEDLNMAIEIDSKNASAYYSRGRVYYEQKEFENAIKDFETSLDFNPENEVAYYNLGMAYYRLENNENACKYFHESCGMGYSLACKMIILECTSEK